MNSLVSQLYHLLDSDDRRSFITFIAISFISSVIEVIGIGSIMPFIGVLMQPDLISNNHILAGIYAALGFEGRQQFLIFMGCVTLTIIIVGGTISIFSVRYQLKVTYRIGHKWVIRLFSAYLHQPYSFFLQANSNAMKSGILSEVDRVVSSVLIPAAVIISKTMVILVVLTLLLFVNPVVTAFLITIIGTVYAGLLFYFRNKMRSRGQDAVLQNKIRFQTTNEAFSSIRDIKLYNNAGFFEDKLRDSSARYNGAQSYSLYHGQIPRFLIEMTGFVALISLILYMISTGGSSVNQVIPLIALFAASGYKVLPAAQSLYASLNSLRFNTAALSVVAEGINLPRIDEDSHTDGNHKLDFNHTIDIKDVSFAYAERGHPVLQNINCTIHKNTLVGVIGPTGAGKSTFIDLLIGLLTPQNGAILIDGIPLDGKNTSHWQHQIGYVPQKIYLLDDSLESNIAFGQSQHTIDEQRVIKAAEQAQIDSFIKTLSEQYKTSAGEHGDHLSGGQRQRMGIARALYRDPAVLVLDEPTSALDAKTADNLLSTLKTLSHSKTVILITHSTDALKYCDQVLLLKDGQLESKQAIAV